VRHFWVSFVCCTILCSIAAAQQSGTTQTLPSRGRGSFGAPPPTTIRPDSSVRPEGTTPSSADSLGLGTLRPSMGPLPAPGTVGKLVTLEVLITDVSSKLEQPTAAQILELDKAGKLSSSDRLRLASLENMTAFVQFGEKAPRVIGRTNTGLSVTPIFNDVNVGTIVQATARLDDDGSALVQLYVQRSAIAKVSDISADPLDPKGIAMMTTQTTVRAQPGKPLLISAGPSTSVPGTQTWIVLVLSAS
jgi:hypothetical protein